jgi:hypothetical protein
MYLVSGFHMQTQDPYQVYVLLREINWFLLFFIPLFQAGSLFFL